MKLIIGKVLREDTHLMRFIFLSGMLIIISSKLNNKPLNEVEMQPFYKLANEKLT